MNVVKEKKNIKRILDILFITIIVVLTIWNLGDCDRIKIVDDEFGYWGIAAMISGFDWSDLMAVTEYYSFGYSIVLIPLLLLHKIGVAMPVIYKLALIMNAGFMALVYCLIRYVINEIFCNYNKIFMQAASLFVTLYIGNIFYTHSAWSETFLLLIFWCVVALVVRFMRNPNWKISLLLMLTSVSLLAIHMRALGIVIAVVIFLLLFFLCNRKKINKKYMITFLVSTVLFLGIFAIIKDYVTVHMYCDQKGTSVNDFPMQVSKVKSMLSVSGMVDLIMSILGKIYYSGAASFLLSLIGFVSAIFNVLTAFINSVRKKENRDRKKQWFVFFALMAFLGELGITAIFKCVMFFAGDATKTSYMDNVVFGRYLDFATGPMILLGIIALCEVENHFKEVILAGILFLVSAFASQYQIDILTYYNETNIKGFRQNASPWLSFLYQGNLNYFLYYAAGISSLIFLVIFLLNIFDKKRKYGIAIALTIAGILSGICGASESSEFVNSKIGKAKTVETVENVLRITESDVPIYMVVREDSNITSDSKILQWTLGERGIHTLLYTDLQNVDMDQAILLSDSSDDRIRGVLSDRADYIYDSGTIAVFASEQNVYYADLLEKTKEMAKVADPMTRKIDLAGVVTDLSYVKANGSLYYNYQAQEGYLTEGMGVSLEDGVYEFMIDIRIRDVAAGNDAGYITVGDNAGSVQNTVLLRGDDFADKERQTISVCVKIQDGAEPFIGLYTYGEASFRVFDISYKKVIGNIEINPEELKELEECLQKKESGDKVYYIDSDNSAITGFPVFGDYSMSYLPGDILTYRENYANTFCIAEKTDMEVVASLSSQLSQVLETQNFVAFR